MTDQAHLGPPPDWERLDPRVVAAKVVRGLGPIVPIVVGLTLFGQRARAETTVTVVALGLGAVAVTIAELVRWARTEFRLTVDRVELRSGLLTRTHLTVPRDRIRRVELTSPLLHRLLGLSVVTVGTAERGADGDTITLDAVPVERAATLRQQLLGTVHADPSLESPDRPGGELIAGLSWRWAPYNVLSVGTVAFPAVVVGGLSQLASSAGVEVDPDSLVEGAGWLRSAEWWIVAAVVGSLAVVVGALASLAVFATTWWSYELRREHGDALRMTRGLFTTRTTVFDEHRLRGVELHESLAQRAAGGCRVIAIAHGRGGAEQAGSDRQDALAPPCPRAEADRIAGLVLRCDTAPTTAQLTGHPVAARSRRLVRAAVDSVVTIAIGAAAIGPGPAPLVVGLAVVLVCAGSFAHALASYRSLGHAVVGPYLVARRGVLIRRTTALERTGIIGWTIRQTWFQRRRGLADLVATTAAGAGEYLVEDLLLEDAALLAARATVGPGSFPASLAFAA